MVPHDQFFRETTLRICGSLNITTAIADVFDYFKQHFPLIGLSLTIRDQDLGALRRIALATDNQDEYPEEILPISSELWTEVQEMAATMHEPLIISPDHNELIRKLSPLFKLKNKSNLILPLWMDGSLQGALNFRGNREGCFTSHHLELVSEISQPFTIALANAIAHEKIRRYRDLLIEDNQFLSRELSQRSSDEIIGKEGGLSNVIQMVRQVAPLNNTVLLLGETGTGKELIANAIHFSSPFKDGPFIKVNCGAIPEHLIDSELFGHEKGSFTGAISDKRGRFERANRGTIFLDEIGELPPQAQIRLLRVLQNRVIDRVGGHKPIPLDIRVIAATHRNLESMVRENTFREDLWFRLNVFPIIIPPLRQRREDIAALTMHFLARKAREIGLKNLPTIMPGALERMQHYGWPGNVRELENLVERELILHRDGNLYFDNLPFEQSARPVARGKASVTRLLQLDQVVTGHIVEVLQHCQGKINGTDGAADILGIHPNTLRARMNKLGIRYGRRA
ncbi:MAG: sigma 54-interacting transcriptional regulator [Desulfobulbus sp.]|nr:sigma 54-interacting transcriptional regulator [Desulfobulbus sp.]